MQHHIKFTHLAIIGLLALAGPAQLAAHSKQEITLPVDGASLAEGPPRILMQFNALTLVTLFRIVDERGQEHAYQRVGEMAPAREFAVTPEELSQGSYTITWRGLSADGHPVEGEFGFTIE